MNRGSFFKKLFQGAAVAAISPSVLGEIGTASKVNTIDGVTCTSGYIEGYTRITKGMIDNLPFLKSELPKMLMRDYMKAENEVLFGELSKHNS
jgi:hypothetical protein